MQDLDHSVVDVLPPSQDVLHGGTGEEASLGSRVLVAHDVVVAVEQNRIGWTPEFEIGFKLLQHHDLVKPGDMGQVPFGRTCVVHRLGLTIFGTESFEQIGALAPGLKKAFDQRFALSILMVRTS